MEALICCNLITAFSSHLKKKILFLCRFSFLLEGTHERLENVNFVGLHCFIGLISMLLKF